jgi:hypothetical protein
MSDTSDPVDALAAPPVPTAISARTLSRARAVFAPPSSDRRSLVAWLLLASATVYAADACLKMAVIFGG